MTQEEVIEDVDAAQLSEKTWAARPPRYCGFASSRPRNTHLKQWSANCPKGDGCKLGTCGNLAACDAYCNACSNCGGFDYGNAGGYRCWMKSKNTISGTHIGAYVGAYRGPRFQLRVNDRAVHQCGCTSHSNRNAIYGKGGDGNQWPKTATASRCQELCWKSADCYVWT